MNDRQKIMFTLAVCLGAIGLWLQFLGLMSRVQAAEDPKQDGLVWEYAIPKFRAVHIIEGRPKPAELKSWPDDKGESPRDLSIGYVDLDEERIHVFKNNVLIYVGKDLAQVCSAAEYGANYTTLPAEVKKSVILDDTRTPKPREFPVPAEPEIKPALPRPATNASIN